MGWRVYRRWCRERRGRGKERGQRTRVGEKKRRTGWGRGWGGRRERRGGREGGRDKGRERDGTERLTGYKSSGVTESEEGKTWTSFVPEQRGYRE